MKKEDIVITPVHYRGPYYRSIDPPHYIFHVEGINENIALTWAYNANGAVVKDKISIDSLESYQG